MANIRGIILIEAFCIYTAFCHNLGVNNYEFADTTPNWCESWNREHPAQLFLLCAPFLCSGHGHFELVVGNG